MDEVKTLQESRAYLVNARGKALSDLGRLERWISDLEELISTLDAKLREREPSRGPDLEPRDRKVKGTISLIDAVEQVFHNHPNTRLSVAKVWRLANLLGAQSDANHPTTVVSSCIRRLMEEHDELQTVGRGVYVWRSTDISPGQASDRQDHTGSAALSVGLQAPPSGTEQGGVVQN